MNTLLAAVETQFGRRVESEQRMRQFLLDASHELRTPLTSIRGYAELARMQRAFDTGASSPATLAENQNLDRIESEGTRMSRLVDDILMLARGDEGVVPQFDGVNVDDLLADAVANARAAFSDRTIDIVTEAELLVAGDRDQLLRALNNLITNAAVHTASSDPINVSAAHDDDIALISVKDHGPGLPADEVSHVFDRFWRADKARTRVRGGSGLGLSIVASIVYNHGGTIRFDSSVEAGSTVTMRIPQTPRRSTSPG
jgi:two-component system OmpR family sensor kinase